MKTMEEILNDVSENISRISFSRVYDKNGKIIFDYDTPLKKLRK